MGRNLEGKGEEGNIVESSQESSADPLATTGESEVWSWRRGLAKAGGCSCRKGY